MKSLLGILRKCGILDPGVLAVGIERGWASRSDAADYALERVSAGDDRPQVAEVAGAEALEPRELVHLLRCWARLDELPSEQAESALRRWMFASLRAVSRSGTTPEEKLDRLEEAYAALGYPEEMRKCSRYYVPAQDRARGLRVGDVTSSPLDAMNQLLLQLGREFGVT